MAPKIGKHHLAAAAAALGLWSATGAANETREHDAHEHGHGTLDIVAAGDQLVLELRIPAVNVVGFEHQPGNDEQRRAVNAAIETFKDPAALFEPTAAAACRVEEVRVELAGMAQGDTEGHASEHRDEHGDKEDDHGDETHSELEADYHFHCDEPQALDGIAVRIFEHLLGADEIEARVVTDTMQTAVELTADSAVLQLRQ